MKENDIVDQFTEFLRAKYYKDLAQAVSLGNNTLRVDFQELDKFNPALADAILEKPAENLELINKSVEEIDFPKKQAVNIRFFNLPESTAIRIRNLRAEHIGNFLTIDGIVKRASEVRPEISEIVFECQECEQRLKIIQDKKSKKVKYPVRCDCGNRRNFKIVKEKLYDARWIAVEEPFEITTGERPSEIMVYLKEDLVSPRMRNRSEPGNRIKVFGVLEEIPRTTSRGKKTRQMDILIHANNFEVSEEEWEEIEIDPEEEKKIKEFAKDPKIYEKLTASLAPTMYGLEPIKLSIVLQLFGGTPHELKDGTRIRGDIHILLIGDPSTGKSRLLKLASDMMPRGKYVSGKGVTGAGLCVKGDSKVVLGDGRILKIRDLVEGELKKGEVKKENGIIVAKNPKKQKVISLDEKDMKVKPLEISQYWKIPAPEKMVRITTRSGKTVECTLDNPIPTIEDGDVVWKNADSVSDEDSVATVREISEKLANSDIFWDEIEKVEIIENDSEDFVYDLTIEGTHSFMANGMIVHNTASVVKDEQFMGGWVLEAGALVLANKSMVCLHPDTKVILRNRICPISQLFDENCSENVILNSGEAKISSVFGTTPSFNLKNKKCQLSKPTIVRKKKFSGKILKMKLDSGFEIKLTPDHKLIDGNTMKWKEAGKFTKGDYVTAPLFLPKNEKKVYIFDLIPDEWKVCLDPEEKSEIKKEIMKNYKSLSEFNKKFNLSRHIFGGGNQLTKNQFVKIMNDLKLLDKWKNRCLKYGRKNSSNRLSISYLTPELGYVLGFIFGDGYIKRKKGHRGMSVTQSVKHQKYVDKFVECFKSVFGEEPHQYRSKKKTALIKGREVESEHFNIYYGSNVLVELYDKIVGKNLENLLLMPNEVLKAFIGGTFDADGCISVKKSKKNGKDYEVAHVVFLISNDDETNLNFILALRRFDVYSKLVDIGKKVDIIRTTGRKDVITLKKAIKKYSEKIKVDLPKRTNKVSSIGDKLPSFLVADICTEIIGSLNTSILNKKGISSVIYDYKNFKYQPSRDQMAKILRRLDGHLNEAIKSKVSNLLERDFFLDKIVEISEEDYDGFVYDLYVPGSNNFLANGIFVHNCIDEFEKVNKEDQVAMHEALSLQTVSIAKASIVATLPSKTSILAGANPKLSRFDPYIPIREQINIPETLLSRFDLKFALRDVPDAQKDEKIVDHILDSRHFKTDEIVPKIDPTFLKKYIAYTKLNCEPELTKTAGKKLKDFYISLRSKSTSEEAPVPITLRQYEGLIRLAEASAKVRLSEKVEEEDAKRAIEVLKYSLRQFGFDPETGLIDIDRAEGAMATSSQRSKIRIMLDVIDELHNTIGKNIPVEEITRRAKEEGVERPSDIIKKMKEEGLVFEPKPRVIQKV